MQTKIIDFSRASPIKIGGICEVKIAQNIDEILFLKDSNFLLGSAHNTLISPDFKNLFMLGNEFDFINDFGDFIEVGARFSARKLFLFAKNNNLGGFEFLSAIPGTLGGLIKMNAGMKQYEISNILSEVCINGEWIAKHNIAFSYRKSGICGAISAARFVKKAGFSDEIKIECQKMRSNQPKNPNLGSCFKNPPNDSAGRLLERVGLRGFSLNKMAFSDIHANFLINLGGGDFASAKNLINLAKTRVKNECGIQLENEIILLEP